MSKTQNYTNIYILKSLGIKKKCLTIYVYHKPIYSCSLFLKCQQLFSPPFFKLGLRHSVFNSFLI